jgi:hypothetical protein
MASVVAGARASIAGRWHSVTRLSDAERVERNARIRADRAHGLRWTEVAARNGVSVRQAQKVWADEQTAPITRAAAIDRATEVLDATLNKYDRVEVSLERLASDRANSAVQLGAIKAQLQVLRDRTALLQSLGLLSARTLQIAAHERDFNALVDQLLDGLEAHAVPHRVQRAIVESIEAMNAKGGPAAHELPVRTLGGHTRGA